MLAVLLVASPAFAAPADEEPDALPAVCGGKVPATTEDEMLVERTLYFHGTNRLGDVQGGGNVAGTPFLMDPEAPATAETKYKSSKPVVFGNDNFGRNAVNGYWLRDLDASQRVVCAGSSFSALASSDTISIILFFDKPYADTTTTPAVSRVNATAPAGNGFRTYTGIFNVDRVAETDISIQFAPAAPGAILAYDSTEAPSSFTYVTVEPRPEETP